MELILWGDLPKYIRRVANAWSNAPIYVKGKGYPSVEGRSGYWTNKTGREVLYPKAYVRKGSWRNIIYHRSTLGVYVGIDWLQTLQAPYNECWYDASKCETRVIQPFGPLCTQASVFKYEAKFPVGTAIGAVAHCGDVVYHHGIPVHLLHHAKNVIIHTPKVYEDPIFWLAQTPSMQPLADVLDEYYNRRYYETGLPRGVRRIIVAAARTLDGQFVAIYKDSVGYAELYYDGNEWRYKNRRLRYETMAGSLEVNSKWITINGKVLPASAYEYLWTSPEMVALYVGGPL